MAKDATIDAGCYFFVTIPEANKIKIEIKNVKEKSKITDDAKGTIAKAE